MYSELANGFDNWCGIILNLNLFSFLERDLPK